MKVASYNDYKISQNISYVSFEKESWLIKSN